MLKKLITAVAMLAAFTVPSVAQETVCLTKTDVYVKLSQDIKSVSTIPSPDKNIVVYYKDGFPTVLVSFYNTKGCLYNTLEVPVNEYPEWYNNYEDYKVTHSAEIQ